MSDPCPVTMLFDGRDLICQNREPNHRFHRFLRTQGRLRTDDIESGVTVPDPARRVDGLPMPPRSDLPTPSDLGGIHHVTERVLEHVRSSVRRQYGGTTLRQ